MSARLRAPRHVTRTFGGTGRLFRDSARLSPPNSSTARIIRARASRCTFVRENVADAERR